MLQEFLKEELSKEKTRNAVGVKGAATRSRRPSAARG
jgi:hypothetical protein